jgi:hypothetical protein
MRRAVFQLAFENLFDVDNRVARDIGNIDHS